MCFCLCFFFEVWSSMSSGNKGGDGSEWAEPIEEGELTKEGHVVHNWKTRWFVLVSGKLFYFRQKPTPEVKFNQLSQLYHNFSNRKQLIENF